jgi:predicted N-acyltransferase
MQRHVTHMSDDSQSKCLGLTTVVPRIKINSLADSNFHYFKWNHKKFLKSHETVHQINLLEYNWANKSFSDYPELLKKYEQNGNQSLTNYINIILYLKIYTVYII